MTDTVIVTAIVAAMFLVPLALYAFTSYEAPHAVRDSLKGAAGTVFVAFAVTVGWQAVRSSAPIGEWHWNYLLGVLLGAPIKIGIDWLMIRRERLRTTI